MVKVGLLVRLVAKSDMAEELAQFLEGAQLLAEAEPFTPVWFVYRESETVFYITDAFASDEDRQRHLEGQIASALMAHAPKLLAESPQITPVDILAAKVQA